ncbi:MAG TPA: hypothetical protein VN894_02405 [Polyangiaceae bacterium]|nr:hypothetical protein [Polyangiaceae bacterium]
MRLEGEALVVGMTLVPGLLSRNRSFDLFENPEVHRARRRATLLRGIVRQIAGAQGAIDSLHVARVAARVELSYRLPGLKMRRQASLNDLELACVRYLAERASVAGLRATEEDRAAIDAALMRLSAGLRLAEIDAGGKG